MQIQQTALQPRVAAPKTVGPHVAEGPPSTTAAVAVDSCSVASVVSHHQLPPLSLLLLCMLCAGRVERLARASENNAWQWLFSDILKRSRYPMLYLKA